MRSPHWSNTIFITFFVTLVKNAGKHEIRIQRLAGKGLPASRNTDAIGRWFMLESAFFYYPALHHSRFFGHSQKNANQMFEKLCKLLISMYFGRLESKIFVDRFPNSRGKTARWPIRMQIGGEENVASDIGRGRISRDAFPRERFCSPRILHR